MNTAADTALSLTPILQPLLDIAGLVITGLLAVYVPRGIAAFEARTGIQLTEQQRQTVLRSVQTGAGELETLLDQRAITAAHINISDPNVLAKARAAVDAVPVAAAAMGVNEQAAARMIVGLVDTSRARLATPAQVAVSVEQPAAAPAVEVVAPAPAATAPVAAAVDQSAAPQPAA